MTTNKTEDQNKNGAVLMFSGGRDSTLAALRLTEQKIDLTLVTVVAEHLIGFAAVRRRVDEIKGYLKPGTRWITASQLQCASDFRLNPNTCLPCQRDYALIGASLAVGFGFSKLAFGYTKYQSDWPEQSAEAQVVLKKVLAEHGIELLLPVYDLESKDSAKQELAMRGLTADALEQKCIKQISNITLAPDLLAQELISWEIGLREKLRSPEKWHANIVEQIVSN